MTMVCAANGCLSVGAGFVTPETYIEEERGERLN